MLNLVSQAALVEEGSLICDQNAPRSAMACAASGQGLNGEEM